MTVLDSPALTGPTPGALSAAMREGSMAEHKAAEGSNFVESLLAGRVDERGYVAFLGRLRTIYAALESVGRSLAGDPVAGAVHDPVLERLEAIDDDLDFWSGGTHPLVSSKAADAYAARIEASAEWGGLYVAHHYTRYLGDLSGGQAFRAVLQREFDLTDRGVGFYTFAEVPKPKRYKDAYRARLDALGLGAADQQRVVDEVKVAFTLNQQLFAELNASLDSWVRVPR
jgi:heme oxygenase